MLKRVLIPILVLFLCWLVAATVLFVVHHGNKPVKADAIYVLSGSANRLPVGLRLARRGYAPLLVISKSGRNASVLERQACAHQLDVEVLCVQAKPYSTVGEAEELGRLARERHWTAVDVVTSSYHVLRARMIVRRCFDGTLRVIGAPNQDVWLPWNMVLESIKLPYHELVHRSC